MKKLKGGMVQGRYLSVGVGDEGGLHVIEQCLFITADLHLEPRSAGLPLRTRCETGSLYWRRQVSGMATTEVSSMP